MRTPNEQVSTEVVLRGGWVSGQGERAFSLTVEDRRSSVEIIRVVLDAHELLELLSGASTRAMPVALYGLSRVGMWRSTERRQYRPDPGASLTAQEGEAYPEWLAERVEATLAQLGDGWEQGATHRNNSGGWTVVYNRWTVEHPHPAQLQDPF